jgi:hypothetical protein
LSVGATKTLDEGKGLSYLDHVMKNQNTTQKVTIKHGYLTKQAKDGSTLYAGRRLGQDGKVKIVWMSIPE